MNAKSTAEEVTEGLDLTGKIALITGCNTGLGFETMRVLAMRGAHVIGTGRTVEKAKKACESVEGKTTPLAMELTDFDSIVTCANSVKELNLNLDMLILNAGMFNFFHNLELVNGIEKMFVVNFLSHFIFVNQLLPIVKGRIVHVGSRAGYMRAPPEGIDFDNLRGEKEFSWVRAYGRSKLANALFSFELARRLEGTGVTSNVVHPGVVQTNITHTGPTFIHWLYRKFGSFFVKTVQQGAATQVYVATSPTLENVNGAFFEDCASVIIPGPHQMYNQPLAEQLWQTAEGVAAPYLISPK